MSVRFGKDPLGSARERNAIGEPFNASKDVHSAPGLKFVEQHEGEIDQRD